MTTCRGDLNLWASTSYYVTLRYNHERVQQGETKTIVKGTIFNPSLR